jgi:hypothetical protein
MTENSQKVSWLGRALMAVGVSGAAFAALCCFAPLLVAGLVSAIGLGFILKDSILMGLLVMFLGIAGLGLYLARREHV